MSSTDVIRLVAEQRGLPFLDIGPLAVDPAAAKLLPIDFARTLRTLPIGFVRGLPVVALSDPSDDEAIHGTRAILRAAEFVASPEESLLAQLSRAYSRRAWRDVARRRNAMLVPRQGRREPPYR